MSARCEHGRAASGITIAELGNRLRLLSRGNAARSFVITNGVVVVADGHRAHVRHSLASVPGVRQVTAPGAQRPALQHDPAE